MSNYSTICFLKVGKVIYMNRLCRIAFICLFCLALMGEAHAANDTLQLKVGYMPETGFFVEDWPGHFSGYGYEYMESLSSYASCDFEYVPYPDWESCLAALAAGEVDVLPGIPGDPKKAPGVKQTDHVVGRFAMALVVHEGLDKTQLTLGAYEKGFSTPKLSDIVKEEGYTYDLREYETQKDMMDAYLRGGIDGFVAPILYRGLADLPDGHILAQFDRKSYRLVTREDNDELFDRINVAMEYMLLYQPNIRAMLHDKYIRSDGGAPLSLSRVEREYLREKGKLRVMMFGDRKPISYFEDGEPKGVVYDVMQMIGRDLGVGIEIVEPESQEEDIINLRAGKVDILANLYSDFSWANTLNLRMTTPYLNVDYVPVSRRDVSPSRNPVIACPSTLFYIQADLGRIYSHTQLKYFDSADDCLKAVSEGEADMTYLPSVMADYITWSGSYQNLLVGSETAFSHSLSIGVSHNADPRLMTILDQEINMRLDKARVRQLMRDAAQIDDVGFSFQRLFYLYPEECMIAVVCGVILISLAGIYRYRLGKKHAEDLAEEALKDPRTKLPNLMAVENRLPALLESQNDAFMAHHIYVVLVVIESKVLIGDTYGRDAYLEKLRELVENVREENPWVLLSGIDRGHPIYICTADGDDAIEGLVSEMMGKHGYVDTMEARIWLNPAAGICSLHPNGFTLLEAVRRADTAAHELVGSKTRIRFFDEQLSNDIKEQKDIERSMEAALANGEFKAWFQPKYDIATHRQVGAEALVRWERPGHGLVPPGKFIPLFEKNGFVLAVDHSLLVQTCEMQRRRLDAGLPIVTVSVNQSRLHFTEEGYLERMRAVVEKYRLPSSAVELELTETIFGDVDDVEESENSLRIVRALHDMGFALSVDDFGSGYSSFMMLNQLPMDVMKIDRSLLQVSEDSSRMRSILGRVIQLGKDLNMKILCEGIETPEQEALLLELGCHYGQGYLNGKPMPMEAFEKFIAEREIIPAEIV